MGSSWCWMLSSKDEWHESEKSSSFIIRWVGKGRHVKLREMIAVFVELPLVSNAILMKRLKVTKQAVDYLLSQLGSSLPRELTGRERYRAWGVL